MKSLITKTMVKIVIATVICMTISMILTAIVPPISNDLALGQLENDNFNFAVWNIWNQVSNYVDLIYFAIGAICVASIGKDFYAFYKTKKEENN